MTSVHDVINANRFPVNVMRLHQVHAVRIKLDANYMSRHTTDV